MLFGATKPILPGKMDRARRVAEELAEHREEYEALNARYRLRSHAMWASHLVSGIDMWVNVYEMDEEDLWPMGRRTWDLDSAYDRWWLEWTKDVLGVDMLVHGGFAAPPEPLFQWPTSGRESATPAADPG